MWLRAGGERSRRALSISGRTLDFTPNEQEGVEKWQQSTCLLRKFCWEIEDKDRETVRRLL